MGIAGKLNSSRRETMPEDINTKELTFIKAHELAKTNPPYPIPILGFFINNKGDYGPSVTLAVNINGDILGLNLPSRYVDMFKDLDDDEVQDILNGGLQITGIKGGVKTKNGTTCFIEFEDVDPGEIPFN